MDKPHFFDLGEEDLPHSGLGKIDEEDEGSEQ
jgi:hypothetical protein